MYLHIIMIKKQLKSKRLNGFITLVIATSLILHFGYKWES